MGALKLLSPCQRKVEVYGLLGVVYHIKRHCILGCSDRWHVRSLALYIYDVVVAPQHSKHGFRGLDVDESSELVPEGLVLSLWS